MVGWRVGHYSEVLKLLDKLAAFPLLILSLFTFFPCLNFYRVSYSPTNEAEFVQRRVVPSR